MATTNAIIGAEKSTVVRKSPALGKKIGGKFVAHMFVQLKLRSHLVFTLLLRTVLSR